VTACACADSWSGAPAKYESELLQGEARLLRPLVQWLRETRRAKPDTHIALELAWFGRRIDVAMLTRSHRTVAYELKLGGLGRALEQAAYNRLSFDRSYVVTQSFPRPENVALAAKYGIGLIVIRSGEVRLVLDSPIRRPAPEVRTRLLTKLRLARCVDRV
jgi:hypothetical protein